jgi:ATP-dependent Clp protease ATP-binding subunit ClpX
VTANIKLLHSCSFCGKNQTQVKTLIAGGGNGAYICNECVDLCVNVIHPEGMAAQPTPAVDSLSPPEIVAWLDQHVIGQNLAKRTLAVAIMNHLRRIRTPEIDGVSIDKSNILMIGSSGSGKSLMVNTLSKLLKVPFATVDATSLSQTGYVGLDPEECLSRLFQSAENDMARAQQGIIFVDEIDKIGRKSGENVSTTRDVSGEGVQQALLKIIEGSDVKFTPAGGRKNPNGEFVTMNTRNILFIFGGAFEGLTNIIAARQQTKTSSMGFLSDPQDDNTTVAQSQLLSEVETEDLISFGMIPELVGRIPVILPFDDLDHSTLRRILTEPKNSLIRQFQAQFRQDGIELEFEDAALDAIAAQVLRTKTGARGLRRVVERVLLNSQYNIAALREQNVDKLIVNQQTVVHNQEPLMILGDQ